MISPHEFSFVPATKDPSGIIFNALSPPLSRQSSFNEAVLFLAWN